MAARPRSEVDQRYAIIVKHFHHPSKHNTEQVLRLRMNGYAYEDIADELDMPIGSVRSALFRTRNVLADAMGKVGV